MSRFLRKLTPALALALAACWPFRKEAVPTATPTPVTGDTRLTLARPTEESDPRLAWISELIQPRFGQDRRGLFDGSLAAGLQPRAGELPVVAFATEGDARLKTPDLAPWLSAGTPGGAVRLSLQPIPSTLSPATAWLRTLVAFLSATKAPKLFKPRVEAERLAPRVGDAPARAVLPGALIVQNPYRDPLYREACRYLNGWIQARLLLAPPGPRTESTRPVTIRCVFSWAEEPLPSNAFSLARFPVPLTMSDAIYFPFKTVEDALSPSVWRSLRITR